MIRARYCGPCDRWVPARERVCRQCGADTDSADPDVSPELARQILADLKRALEAPAPLEPCPFSLSAPKVQGKPAVQPGLFEGESDG